MDRLGNPADLFPTVAACLLCLLFFALTSGSAFGFSPFRSMAEVRLRTDRLDLTVEMDLESGGLLWRVAGRRAQCRGFDAAGEEVRGGSLSAFTGRRVLAPSEADADYRGEAGGVAFGLGPRPAAGPLRFDAPYLKRLPDYHRADLIMRDEGNSCCAENGSPRRRPGLFCRCQPPPQPPSHPTDCLVLGLCQTRPQAPSHRERSHSVSRRAAGCSPFLLDPDDHHLLHAGAFAHPRAGCAPCCDGFEPCGGTAHRRLACSGGPGDSCAARTAQGPVAAGWCPGPIDGFGFANVLVNWTGDGPSVVDSTTAVFQPRDRVGSPAAGNLLPVLWKLRTRPTFARYGVPAISVLIRPLGGYWLLRRTVLV